MIGCIASIRAKIDFRPAGSPAEKTSPPVIVAITFHEAAHGWMAERCGDNTARMLGRVSFNPIRHVDPFGTLLLPGLLLLLKAPFLFGYAKPVPVNFGRLRHPKRDMIWVALAGPGVNVLLPKDYVGTVMELCQTRRGTLLGMEYLSEDRVELRYHMPLGEIVFDFFDHLKSRTQGYASLDYEPWGYQEADLVRVDVLLHGEPVDAFSTIVHREKSYSYGKQMVERLRELIPRQLFDIPVQSAVGSRVLARETVKAMRKDVTAKLYGGDVTRKQKLLKKQKAGKKRMKQVGRVEVPQEAFLAVLEID